MEALVSLWLKEIASADTRPLKEVMNEIGREAQRRGMTPEILDSLLKDELTEEEILDDFPDLTREDLKACIAYAADRERRLMTAPVAA